MAHELPFRDDEIRTLRAMMQEYRQDQAVHRWLGSKWRGVGLAIGLASAFSVLTASVIEIAKTLHL